MPWRIYENRRKEQMKITVNGGNGFIGSKLVTKLLEYRHKVVILQPDAGMSSKPMLLLAFLITSALITTSTLMAQKAITPPAHETITPLITKDLAGLPGEQVLMYTVDFPPGFSSPIHRHNAQVSVYVLEGSVVMQVRGGKEMTLTPGQSFYEDPNDIHVVSRNASSTKPAKFLVFLINKKDAPLVIPAK
jgi:quercetin dioxygenase-like cupin family protein